MRHLNVVAMDEQVKILRRSWFRIYPDGNPARDRIAHLLPPKFRDELSEHERKIHVSIVPAPCRFSSDPGRKYRWTSVVVLSSWRPIATAGPSTERQPCRQVSIAALTPSRV